MILSMTRASLRQATGYADAAGQSGICSLRLDTFKGLAAGIDNSPHRRTFLTWRNEMPIIGYDKQFASKVERGEKRQTIRIGWKRVPKPGQIGYHYTGPYNDKRRKLGEWPIKIVAPIVIDRNGYTIDHNTAGSITFSDPQSLSAFAIADGFESWDAMRAYFLNNGGLPAEGHLICW